MPDEGAPDPEPIDAEIEAPTATPAPTAAPAPVPGPGVDPGYTAGGVPTLDSVREKIETRYGTAIGATELDADTPEGRTVEEQYDARQRAAAERLEQIRQSMRDDADRPDNT